MKRKRTAGPPQQKERLLWRIRNFRLFDGIPISSLFKETRCIAYPKRWLMRMERGKIMQESAIVHDFHNALPERMQYALIREKIMHLNKSKKGV